MGSTPIPASEEEFMRYLYDLIHSFDHIDPLLPLWIILSPLAVFLLVLFVCRIVNSLIPENKDIDNDASIGS